MDQQSGGGRAARQPAGAGRGARGEGEHAGRGAPPRHTQAGHPHQRGERALPPFQPNPPLHSRPELHKDRQRPAGALAVPPSATVAFHWRRLLPPLINTINATGSLEPPLVGAARTNPHATRWIPLSLKPLLAPHPDPAHAAACKRADASALRGGARVGAGAVADGARAERGHGGPRGAAAPGGGTRPADHPRPQVRASPPPHNAELGRRRWGWTRACAI